MNDKQNKYYKEKAVIFDIQRFSIHDGHGIRTLVFFKGCPLKCYWCSNPESQNIEKELALFSQLCIRCGLCLRTCPENAISISGNIVTTDRKKCKVCGRCVEICTSGARKIIGREVNVMDVFKEVVKDKAFYRRSEGGVTLSGGEPTLWANFAKDLLSLCLKEDIDTAIETCGYAPWDKLKILIPVTNLFLYDIKCIDEEKHKRYTNFSNKLILDNLKKLVVLCSNIIIRVPIIPNFNDSRDEIMKIASFVKGLDIINEIDLLPYHRLGESKYQNLGRMYKIRGLSTPSGKKINNLKDAVESLGIKCIIEDF